MEERIVIREFHLASDRDDQKARLKAFVYLHQLGDLAWFLLRSGNASPQRSQPENGLRGILDSVTISHEFDVRAKNLRMGTYTE